MWKKNKNNLEGIVQLDRNNSDNHLTKKERIIQEFFNHLKF